MSKSKYEPLKNYLVDLAKRGQRKVSLSFEKVESILGFPLCESAYGYQQWWENSRSHSQAKAWLDAGWETGPVDMRNRIVTFKFKGQSCTGKTQNGYMKTGEDLESTTHIHQSRPVMPRVIIFTPCCMNKSDTEQIQQGSKVARPQDYLEDHELIKRLKDTRKRILDGLAKRKGKRICNPIDLYAGKAYIDLRNSGNKDKIKKTLLSTDNVQWFFLSAGYGVINALEEATDYDASFYDSEVR